MINKKSTNEEINQYIKDNIAPPTLQGNYTDDFNLMQKLIDYIINDPDAQKFHISKVTMKNSSLGWAVTYGGYYFRKTITRQKELNRAMAIALATYHQDYINDLKEKAQNNYYMFTEGYKNHTSSHFVDYIEGLHKNAYTTNVTRLKEWEIDFEPVEGVH